MNTNNDKILDQINQTQPTIKEPENWGFLVSRSMEQLERDAAKLAAGLEKAGITKENYKKLQIEENVVSLSDYLRWKLTAYEEIDEFVKNWRDDLASRTVKLLGKIAGSWDPVTSFYYFYEELVVLGFLGIIIISLALYLPKDGRSIHWLNKFCSQIFLAVGLLSTYDVVFRAELLFSSKIFLKMWDWPYKNNYNDVQFVGMDPFVEAMEKALVLQNDIMFNKIFLILSLFVMALFFYGISDRYYIQNSYDMDFTIIVYLLYLGSFWLFISHSLVSFGLGIEIIALGSYVLAAYVRENKFSAQAGVQYFILGSIPSIFLGMGLAVLYVTCGTFNIEDLDLLMTPLTETVTDIAAPLYTSVSSEWTQLSFEDKVVEVDMPHEWFQWFFKNKNNAQNPYMEHVFSKIDYQNSWYLGIYDDTYPWRKGHRDMRNLLGYFNNGVFKWKHPFQISDPKSLNKLSYFGFNKSSGLYYHIIDSIENEFNEKKKLHLEMFASKINYLIFGVLAILFNLLFKVTAAPFSVWAPTIYEKTPLASATFMTIFTKLILFLTLLKLVGSIFSSFGGDLSDMFLVFGFGSIFYSVVGAFGAKTIKRFFVYSSMNNVGYILAALGVVSVEMTVGIIEYLYIYVITSLVLWFIIMILGSSTINILQLNKIRLYDKKLALIIALVIFSMAGLPPFGGFFVKFEILKVLFNQTNYILAFLLLLMTVFSMFYYIRLVKAMFFDKSNINKHVPIFLSKTRENQLYIVVVLFFMISFYVLFFHKEMHAIINDILEAFIIDYKEEVFLLKDNLTFSGQRFFIDTDMFTETEGTTYYGRKYYTQEDFDAFFQRASVKRDFVNSFNPKAKFAHHARWGYVVADHRVEDLKEELHNDYLKELKRTGEEF